MNYPLISEYVQSIKLAEENLDKLNHLSPVLDADGAPVMSSGNFAVVFKMKDRQTGKFYAVKCFLREQESRDESYKLIASELEYVSSTFLTPIKYLERELFVDTTQSSETEFPVLLMDWVEGLTLDKYIRNHLDDTYRLSLAAYQFCRMGAWLLSQEFAHGDLKPDNIIVKADGQLVLIDYDGMFVPAMRGRKARETGSADYRHPLRSEEVFNASIDDFSIASIALSLKAISLNPALLEEFGADDRLLFSAKDYRDIGNSECLKAVTRLAHDRELSQLLGLFYIAYARNALDYVSFKLLNLEKPEYIPVVEPEIELSTKVTKEDWANAVEDEYEVKYSKDGLRLLQAPYTIESYKIRKGVQMVCDNAFSSCISLSEVAIPDFVISIGKWSFSDCKSLREVVIPNSVTSIWDCAFWGCNSLREVVIPNSVTSIGNCAFSKCSSLCEVIISDSVTSIGDGAFSECSSLCEVIIPDSVTSIGDGAFSACEALHIISHNPMFSEVDDCMLIDNVNHRLISCYNCKEYITIPNSVTSIGDDAFKSCSSLCKVTIPDSVTSIGSRAFGSCSSLCEVIIPDSVTSIGYGFFVGCGSLCEVVIPNSVTSIGEGFFVDCSSLCKVVIPNSVTSIEDDAFYGCSSLCEVVIPDSVTSIGERTFSDCSSLCKVVIPNFVTNIGNEAFANCSSLCKVVIPDSVTSIGNKAFYYCSSLCEVVISDSVTSIGDSAFRGCTSLREVVIPDSVTSIGDYAFSNCSSLCEVVIPNSVTSIKDGFFLGCSSLREMVIPNSVTNIEYGAFWGCSSLYKVVIPNSVTSIGYDAFIGCRSLTSIIVPKNQTQRFKELLKDSGCDLSAIKEQDE